MEEQFKSLIHQKIIDHYNEVKKLLLDKENYKTKVDMENVSLYFSFLESVLQKPYNRLNSVAAFIEGDDGQQTNRMYPFALLNEATKQIINDKFSKAIDFANTLEVSGIDPEFHSLCQEERLSESFNKN